MNDYKKMQLISKETAKIAREKGFDDFFSKELSSPIDNAYQYQIMDWMRKKYNLYIVINPSVTMALKSQVNFAYKIYGKSDGVNFSTNWSSFYNYSTYEECLEYALQEALKFI